MLCRPILKYTVCDSSARNKIHDIELVQNSSIRFISNQRGRTDSVSEARNPLQLQSLENKRKNHRLCFLRQIHQNNDEHLTLSTAYDEIARDRRQVTVTTCEADRGEPTSISTQKSVFLHNYYICFCYQQIINGIVITAATSTETI